MPSTLAQFRARISQALVDTSNVNWATAAIDEALQSALDDYTGAAPFANESLITLPGAGRTVALNEITSLLDVTQIWWPYDSLEDDDVNEAANLVRGFVLRFDDARPVVQLKLALNAVNGTQSASPKLNDEMYVWYTKPHTIQNLASASATTLPAPHESGLVIGASAYAALARAINQADEFNLDPKNPLNLQAWGAMQMVKFQRWLRLLGVNAPVGTTQTFGAGWQLDKWDK